MNQSNRNPVALVITPTLDNERNSFQLRQLFTEAQYDDDGDAFAHATSPTSSTSTSYNILHEWRGIRFDTRRVDTTPLVRKILTFGLPSPSSSIQDGSSASVQLQLHPHNDTLFAHIDFYFEFVWSVNGNKRSNRAVLKFPADRHKIVDIVPGIWAAHPECGVSPITQGAQTRISYSGRKIWAVNLLGGDDFGPHQSTVAHLRSFALHGGTVDIFAPNAGSLDGLADYQRLAAEDANRDPLHRLWDIEARRYRYSPNSIIYNSREDLDCANPIYECPSFRKMLELSTYLGIGLICDEAVNKQVIRICNQSARFITIPNNPNALLMIIISDADAPLTLQDGDPVSVRIHSLNPKDIRDDDWCGTVTSMLPILRASDRFAVIRRHYDSEKGTWCGLDASKLGELLDLTAISKNTAALQLIDSKPSHTVDIRRDRPKNVHEQGWDTLIPVDKTDDGMEYLRYEDEVYTRRGNILTAAYTLVDHELHLTGASATADILLCNRFDLLEDRDIFRHFSVTEATFNKLRDSLSLAQQSVIDRFRAMPGGVALVAGCSGSGKSHILSKVMPCLIPPACNSPREGLRALVSSPIGTNVDDILHSFVESFASLGIQDVIIIRGFRPAMNHAILTMRQDNRKRSTLALDLVAAQIGMADASDTARAIFEEISRRESRQFAEEAAATSEGIEYSIPSWVLAILSEDVGSEAVQRARAAVPAGDLANLRLVLTEYNRDYQNESDEWIHSQRKMAYEMVIECYNEVVKMLLSAVDVVCCTPVTATTLKFVFRPQIYALDDASSAISIDGLGWTFFPGCKFRVFLGDLMQPRPRIRSSPTTNPFALHLERPFFSRLIKAGFPCITHLYEQYNTVESITRLAGDLFYKRSLTCVTPPRAPDEADSTISLVRWGSAMVLIDIGKFRNTHSGFGCNLASVTAVRAVIDQMEGDNPDISRNISIVTPSDAQRNIHESIIHGCAVRDSGTTHGVVGAHLVHTSTTAKQINDPRRPFVILDATDVDSVGSIDTKTLAGIVTRARHGIVIVANTELIEQLEGTESAVGLLFDHIKRHGSVVTFDPQETPNTIWRSIPSFELREVYTDPVDTVPGYPTL